MIKYLLSRHTIRRSIMITFTQFPPKSSDDVAFSPGTIASIESLDSDDIYDKNRLYEIGEAIGRFLYANMVVVSEIDPTLGDTIRQIGRDLTADWIGDAFDQVFHAGLNFGVQSEHIDTIRSSGGDQQYAGSVNYI